MRYIFSFNLQQNIPLFHYRWLRENPPKMKSCPSCKVKASPRDLRKIYCKRIKATDKTEEERLRNLYEAERARNADWENKCGVLQIELAISRSQYTELQNRFERLTANVALQATTSSTSTKTIISTYKMSLEKTLELNRDPGSRAMIYGQRSQSIFVAQKSSQSLFPGYGVRFINADGFNLHNNFMHMSIKQIRDLSLDNDEEMIVSASMDNAVKMYSVPNKCQVDVFCPGDKPIWSCAFDCVRPKYLYLGSGHGTTYTYDIRSPSNYVQEHRVINDSSPVIKICPIPCSDVVPLGGFVVCKLKSMWFYEYNASQNVIASKLMGDESFISLNYDDRTKQLLISLRGPTTRYITAELIRVGHNIALRQLVTITGSNRQVLMTRCAQMKIQDDVVVSAYLEDSKHLTTWNTKKAHLRMQSIPVGDTVFDQCPFYIDHKVFLGALSETKLRLYQANIQ